MALEHYTIEMEMQNRHEQGKFERNIEVAKNLLKMNMAIKDIAKATNLLEEEIIKIKNDMNS